jgi:hypothetical protein
MDLMIQYLMIFALLVVQEHQKLRKQLRESSWPAPIGSLSPPLEPRRPHLREAAGPSAGLPAGVPQHHEDLLGHAVQRDATPTPPRESGSAARGEHYASNPGDTDTEFADDSRNPLYRSLSDLALLDPDSL